MNPMINTIAFFVSLLALLSATAFIAYRWLWITPQKHPWWVRLIEWILFIYVSSRWTAIIIYNFNPITQDLIFITILLTIILLYGLQYYYGKKLQSLHIFLTILSLILLIFLFFHLFTGKSLIGSEKSPEIQTSIQN